MNNLHPITKEYSIVLVPIEAENMFTMIDWGEEENEDEINNDLDLKLKYELPDKNGIEEIYLGTGIKGELIGPLSSITEEKAREMFPDVIYQSLIFPALDMLAKAIEELGIKKEGFKEVIIKHSPLLTV